jgi:hypothetical protein
MRGPNCSITRSDTPASSGVPGPGEMTMRSGVSAAIWSTVNASLRTTFTSAPVAGSTERG